MDVNFPTPTVDSLEEIKRTLRSPDSVAEAAVKLTKTLESRRERASHTLILTKLEPISKSLNHISEIEKSRLKQSQAWSYMCMHAEIYLTQTLVTSRDRVAQTLILTTQT